MIPEYDTVAMQQYTEKYGTEDITPTPGVTAAIDITPDVTSSPDVTVTEIPATGKPVSEDADTPSSSDTGEDREKTSGIHPITLTIVLIGLAALIAAFIFIMKKNYQNRK